MELIPAKVEVQMGLVQMNDSAREKKNVALFEIESISTNDTKIIALGMWLGCSIIFCNLPASASGKPRAPLR